MGCVYVQVRGPALRQAEDVFHRVLQAPPLVPQLCCCLADASAAAAGTAAAAAADAVVDALAAMVHAGAGSSNAASVADHFPLAQMLTAKLNDAADHGVDGDTSLLEVSMLFQPLLVMTVLPLRGSADTAWQQELDVEGL
jgi:hypothetical protein